MRKLGERYQCRCSNPTSSVYCSTEKANVHPCFVDIHVMLLGRLVHLRRQCRGCERLEHRPRWSGRSELSWSIHEFDERHGCRIRIPSACMQHANVSALAFSARIPRRTARNVRRTVRVSTRVLLHVFRSFDHAHGVRDALVSFRHLSEELLHHLFPSHHAFGLSFGMERAFFSQRDHLVCQSTQFFGFRQRGFDPLVLQQLRHHRPARVRLVSPSAVDEPSWRLSACVSTHRSMDRRWAVVRPSFRIAKRWLTIAWEAHVRVRRWPSAPAPPCNVHTTRSTVSRPDPNRTRSKRKGDRNTCPIKPTFDRKDRACRMDRSLRADRDQGKLFFARCCASEPSTTNGRTFAPRKARSVVAETWWSAL